MGAYSQGAAFGERLVTQQTNRAEQLQDEQRQSKHDALAQQLASGAITAPQYAQGTDALYQHEPSESRLSRIHRGLERAVGMKKTADANKAQADAKLAAQPSPAATYAGVEASAKSPQQLAAEQQLAKIQGYTQQGEINNKQSLDQSAAQRKQDHDAAVASIQTLPEDQRADAMQRLAQKEAGIAPKQSASKMVTLDVGGKPTPGSWTDGKAYDQEGKVIPDAKLWQKPVAASQSPDSVYMRLKTKQLNDPKSMSSTETATLKSYDLLQAYKLKAAAARGAAFNASKPEVMYDAENGNAPVLVTAQQGESNHGRYIPVGPAEKAMAKETLAQDIAGTSASTRQAIMGLKQDFPFDMKVKIATAMRADDPGQAMQQLMASSAIGSLTDDQRDFLVNTQNLVEQGMAMRTMLGAGQGSDAMRTAMRSTLPSLLSPDRAYALKQLDLFDATLQRLHRGIPNVKLNNQPMAGQPAPKATPSSTKPQGATMRVKGSDGKMHWSDGKVDLGVVQ